MHVAAARNCYEDACMSWKKRMPVAGDPLDWPLPLLPEILEPSDESEDVEVSVNVQKARAALAALPTNAGHAAIGRLANDRCRVQAGTAPTVQGRYRQTQAGRLQNRAHCSGLVNPAVERTHTFESDLDYSRLSDEYRRARVDEAQRAARAKRRGRQGTSDWKQVYRQDRQRPGYVIENGRKPRRRRQETDCAHVAIALRQANRRPLEPIRTTASMRIFGMSESGGSCSSALRKTPHSGT